MSKSPKVLRKYWPSLGIPATRVLEVMGCESGSGVCPACKPITVAIQFTDDRSGGMHGKCPACGWGGDPFRCYMESHDFKTPADAVASLRAANLRVPKNCNKPAPLKSYQKYVESCKAFEQLSRKMWNRDLANIGGQPVTVLGFPLRPHRNPHWWCTTLTELKYELGDSTVGNNTDGWRMANVCAGTPETPLVIVPEYTYSGDMTAFWIMGADQWTRRSGHSCEPGVSLGGFRPDAAPASWNGHRIVTRNPIAAIGLTSASMRDHNRVPPVALVDDEVTQNMRRILARDQTMHDDVVWPANYVAGITASDINLARKLSCRVALNQWEDKSYTNFATWVAQNVISAAVPWLEALEKVFCVSSDFKGRNLLSDVGWCPAIAAKAKLEWSRSNYDRAEAVMSSVGWQDFEVTSTLTVSETVDGLVDANTGKVLYEAVPVVKRVYRADDGRTRYAGVVKYGRKEYAFDSARFRKDPVAVIDAVLLKVGVTPPRAVPLIVAHLANIAQYYYERDQ